VRALIRHDSRLDVLPEGIHTAVGDVVTGHGLAAACADCDTVVHLVGIIRQTREITFDKVHVGGTTHVVEAATEAGVRRIVHMSALGTGRGIPIAYFETKLRAEEIVRRSGLTWAILRPSVIIGPGSGFVQAVLDLVRKYPVTPVAGPGTVRIEPVDIDDLCAAVRALVGRDDLWGKVYELGGPEALTFNELLQLSAAAVGVRKPMIHIPLGLMFVMARLTAILPGTPPVTTDELRMLGYEALCQSNGFAELGADALSGVAPVSYTDALAKALGEPR
jgi:NADH dehydrogenase